jgi:YVTN family beta-propeller protein
MRQDSGKRMARSQQPKVFLAGRVAVECDGLVVDEARFPGRQSRLLFAYLVAEQGRPVPRDELAEALWGEATPATWDKALTGIVSKLRGLLADGGIDGTNVLTGAFGCYRLELPEGSWVDVIVAANAAQAAEEALAAGDLDKAKAAAALAASLLEQPFLPGEEGAWVEEKRREFVDIRGRALSALADAYLRSGNASEAAKWAEQTVALAPFRETGYRRLMEAHAAGGNRAEALRVYERCRRLLAEELGAYPSPETESIYRELLEAPAASTAAAAALESPRSDALPLGDRDRETQSTSARHDPTPDLADPPAAQAAPPLSPPQPGGQRRDTRVVEQPHRLRRRLVLLAVLAAVGATVAATFAYGWGASGSVMAAHGNSVGVVDARSGRLVADVGVSASPTQIAVGEGAYWVTNADDGSVSRIDRVSKTVVETIPVGSSPSGIATCKGAVWVANSLDGTVSRIDPAVNRVVGQPILVGNGPYGIVCAAGSIWVANTGDGTITRIYAASGRPQKPLPIAATEFAYGAGTLWASERTENRVVRIDPRTLDVVPIAVGNGPTGIAFGHGAAWVANSLDGTVSRLDPETNSVAAVIPVGNGPTAIAVDAREVWVSNQYDGTLARVDPGSNRPMQPISVADLLQGVTAAGDDVLVAVRRSGARHRGGTLTARMNRSPDSIDTALASDTTSWTILSMTSDGLVTFAQAGGLQGTQLVPDLAVSLPTPTGGGKTYSFQLRPNISYSNGRPLKASDFRYTLERDLKLAPSTSTYYGGIVGAAGCGQSPRRCDLSRGIVADDAAGTVTFHLVAPDPEFLYKVALTTAVVPTGTAPREAGKAGTHTLPATGPYVITSYRPKHSLVLGRNPYFHEWSKAAQPDGYPDKIVVEIGGTPDEAVNAVIRGKADVFSSSQSENLPSARLLAAIQTRYASQVHTNPQAATVYLFLNTRVAPFNRLDVRQALNYAADRAAAVRVAGGHDAVQATCQILPPHFPGYRPYCPYTASTKTQGSWAAPDLAKARALIAHSGTRGMKITVWSWADLPGLGPYTMKLLRSLGYRVTLKERGAPGYWYVTDDSRTKAQIGTGEWIANYPAASGFFDPVLTCAFFVPNNRFNTNVAEFCDPHIDRQVKQALAEQVTNPDAARRLWERIDRRTVDQAPWVPLLNPKVVDVLSKRVGNYQYSPAGLGLDQLWVR